MISSPSPYINKLTSPIITVGLENNLILDEVNFSDSVPNLTNKLIIIGAVGKMRVGKSSALNNFHTLLTGEDIRLFDEKESVETNTRGIHIIHIP